MDKFNCISFCKGDYTTRGSNFVNKFDEDGFFNDIKDFLRILVKNGYQCRVYSAEEQSIIFEYNYYDECIGGVSLEWLNEDEYIQTYNKGE